MERKAVKDVEEKRREGKVLEGRKEMKRTDQNETQESKI